MLKKIVLGTLLVGLIGILVVGAVIRTMDKTGQVAEAQGLGHGQGQGNQDRSLSTESEGLGVTGGGKSGQSAAGSGGAGRGGGNADRQYANYEAAPEEWVTYTGTVVQTPADGQDLVIETPAGEEMVVGTGPGYMETQGFSLQAGEQVQVYGYWEDGELKAAELTRLQDGQTVTLRDQLGRPAWAGGGQGGQEISAGEGRVDAPGDGTGTGEAEVSEWLTIQGTVVNVDSYALVVETAGGEEIVIEGRAWSFVQEQGFSVQAGDAVTLVGFYEGEDLEVGQIDSITTGQTVLIREESGRPLWAGRGRQGS